MAVVEATLISIARRSGDVAPNTHIGATNSRRFAGWGVKASLGADAILDCVWRIPNPLPAGTCKLLLARVAVPGGSQNSVVNPAWASSVSENYDTITLSAEGDTTIAWVTGDADKLLESRITLDADTLVAGEYLVMALTFESTGWTLAVRSTWHPSVIWE